MIDLETLPPAIALWKRIATNRELHLIDSLIADDVVFESPVLHTPQVGRELTRRYLAAAVTVLSGPEARYVNCWLADHSAALELTTTVEGLSLNVIDVISWNDDDLVTHFKVFARPAKALQALGALMISQLPLEPDAGRAL
ncbi:hypothetical protein GGQ61_001276 [Phenylobacterium haematophilum]|uniref:SnoaL-like domain-containing protein n=1 Tax=Phenylobacterium haematophilum TaxID=98513 RepID=A0A839ZXV4_9CAUL|nr:nuclear transport factor 2 family protein [Phenylobacterium haematophilum]MBB3890559.1 hypothetical protein [Phenylobacterium haematophilum]